MHVSIGVRQPNHGIGDAAQTSNRIVSRPNDLNDADCHACRSGVFAGSILGVRDRVGAGRRSALGVST